MHYTVKKIGKNWVLTHQGTVLGKYPTKSAATVTGRLLAGFRGTVTVVAS